MLLLMRVFFALTILTAGNVFGQVAKPLRIEGQTMGTSYSITYFDSEARNFKSSIDSLLREVNHGISNYDPASDVSSFNRSVAGGNNYSTHFRNAFYQTLAYAKQSGGNFDFTVMPLVNLWGFGPGKSSVPTQQKIDSIKAFVGYQHVNVLGDRILKDHANVQVDFGGIGQGYGVDVICDFLRATGIRNFLVELGGEGYASGKNLERNDSWRVGIIDPMLPKDEQQLMGYAVVEDEAFSTSGNYFNYRVIDGKKYGHTISAFTGFPVDHELISVSVFAKECTSADAWDTAMLAGGIAKTEEFLEQNPELGAVLTYNENGVPRIRVTENYKTKIFLDSPYDH